MQDNRTYNTFDETKYLIEMSNEIDYTFFEDPDFLTKQSDYQVFLKLNRKRYENSNNNVNQIA